MTAAAALDTFLDRTIAFGYGNVGLAIRRRLPDWPADPPRMDGKVALVTGAGSGPGRASAPRTASSSPSRPTSSPPGCSSTACAS
ncbi:MAG: hypothetical protein WKF94_08810 [Solirubrobacteraceae bacterium]